MPETPEIAAEKIAAIKGELQAYGEKYKLRGLEGRIQRGLDPAGMLAVNETRKKLENIAKTLGADIENVIGLTNELHVGAIWKNADALAEGSDPTMKTWMVAGEVTTAGKEKEGDLTDDQFVEDLQRVNTLLDEAVRNPEAFFARSKTNLIDRSKEQFELRDGVPYSTLDSGFLAMAANGYKAGIIEDKGGLLFIGANELDYDSLGLNAVEKEDKVRKTKSIFYVDANGNDVVKKLYPGFAIVYGKNFEIAKKLAQSGIAKAEKARGE